MLKPPHCAFAGWLEYFVLASRGAYLCLAYIKSFQGSSSSAITRIMSVGIISLALNPGTMSPCAISWVCERTHDVIRGLKISTMTVDLENVDSLMPPCGNSENKVNFSDALHRNTFVEYGVMNICRQYDHG